MSTHSTYHQKKHDIRWPQLTSLSGTNAMYTTWTRRWCIQKTWVPPWIKCWNHAKHDTTSNTFERGHTFSNPRMTENSCHNIWYVNPHNHFDTGMAKSWTNYIVRATLWRVTGLLDNGIRPGHGSGNLRITSIMRKKQVHRWSKNWQTQLTRGNPRWFQTELSLWKACQQKPPL